MDRRGRSRPKEERDHWPAGGFKQDTGTLALEAVEVPGEGLEDFITCLCEISLQFHKEIASRRALATTYQGDIMGLLDGKNALIFGLANERSIAWGITQAFKREGANIGISYAGEMLEKRVKPLAEQVDCKWVEECEVTKDDQINKGAE